MKSLKYTLDGTGKTRYNQEHKDIRIYFNQSVYDLSNPAWFIDALQIQQMVRRFFKYMPKK